MKRNVCMILVLVLVITAFTPAYGLAEMTKEERSPAEFVAEKEAHILTDEASAAIKRQLQVDKNADVDKLLAPYFQNCERREVYRDDVQRAVSEGATRYRELYSTSKIFTYKKKSGIWNAIANATISTILGEVKSVGKILSYAYSVISGYAPDYEAEAEAKTQYSYRYIECRGEVYCLDAATNTYKYGTYAVSVSREKYQHEYGYYADVTGHNRSHTRDYPKSIETLNAPHRGDAAWLKNRAKTRWQNDQPAYYEDWND